MDHEESCNLFVDVKYAIGSGVEVYGDQKADEILKEARTPNTKQYRLELYTQAYNLLNHTNLGVFSGVLTSPYFGRATSAQLPRRFELGMRFNF